MDCHRSSGPFNGAPAAWKRCHHCSAKETFREPISILPIFKGLRGMIFWDENDAWYQNWKQELMLNDGLVKLELASRASNSLV